MNRWSPLLPMVTLASCAGRQTMLDPEADQAQAIDGIWRLMLWVCGGMYLIVMALLIWALVRARRGALQQGAPVTGHSAAEALLERGVAVWVGVVVLGLFVLAGASFVVDRALAVQAPAPLHITVTANQFWWNVQYDGEAPDQRIITANELYLPLNRAAEIELRSNDVIHSLWIPNLAGKRDLIPGRINHVTITPRRAGLYRGQCAEFCGLEHAWMALDIRVLPAQDFSHWYAGQLVSAASPTTAELQFGQHVFLSHACASCHAISGTNAGGVTGPDLSHFGSRRTLAAGMLPNQRGALAGWIANPQALKPGVAMPAVDLSPAELNALSDYLESLK
jgi:cytochrome c oxidase subunit 2